MNTYREQVKSLYYNLKFDTYAFGLAGELYIKRIYDNPGIQPYSNLINKYISTNSDDFYVNRKPVYFSPCFDDAICTISEIPEEYSTILELDIPTEFKRYLLFTFTEYMMHSISKLLNVCFIHISFQKSFYKALKYYLADLSNLLVDILFNEQFHEMKAFEDETCKSIVIAAKELNIANLREHIEMDHKILLIIGYMLYFDYIHQYDLIISPLLGAAQIPTVFNALCNFINKHDIERQPINYEYIKYSTYEEDEPDCFFSIEEQLQWLSKYYSSNSKVLLIDESLGTGTTVLKIKKILDKYFATVDTASIEYRWDKKIIWNTDRDWFNINDIDYVTPISYRHYITLDKQIADLKKGAM